MELCPDRRRNARLSVAERGPESHLVPLAFIPTTPAAKIVMSRYYHKHGGRINSQQPTRNAQASSPLASSSQDFQVNGGRRRAFLSPFSGLGSLEHVFRALPDPATIALALWAFDGERRSGFQPLESRGWKPRLHVRRTAALSLTTGTWELAAARP